MIADLTNLAVNSAESSLHIFEKTFPKDKRPFAAIESAKENIRRTKSGEERLPKGSTAAVVLDAYAASSSAAACAAAAAAAAGVAAYAAGDISPHLFLNATTAAYAVAVAGIAQKEGCDKTKKNQKEIILKYFQ